MDLIETQTFGFIITFLVAFAGLVIACAKCFPNENIRRSTQKTKVPVRLEDHDQPLLRNRRPTIIPREGTPIKSSVGTLQPRPHSSTPGAPTPPAEPPSPTSRAPPLPPTPHTPKAISPSPTTIEPTLPIRGPTPTPKAPTPTTMPPISTPSAPTPTPRAPIPLATPPTPTPRALTPPDRAPTPPPVTPIQQQADMAQQLAEEQELGMEVWPKSFDQSTRKLKKYLIPDEIIDLDTGFELFSFTDRRDTKEETNTTKKNEVILTKVRSKGELAYIDFKERLKMTNQSKLAELLTYTERGLNTEEIEQQLDKMLEELITRTIYDKQKRELQGDLIKFYINRCSSIPLSPLLEEIETPLAGFYVMPDIVAVKQKSLNSNEEIRIPVKSLRSLFSFGNRDQQEMYLSADAGFGKTALSKYLAVTWCQAHCHDENYACFKKSEIKTLLDFEFLFLIFLRDSHSVCKIDDMIEQQITGKLPTSVILDEVLRREKCLIILDGLDEWTHPDNSCNEVTDKIPHRYVRDNCVILTTTRPWKLGVLNLKTSQINKKVELVQLSADSTRKLEENAIRKMTGVRDDRVLKRTQDFNKVIRYRRLEHMQGNPLLLMYIVCLWCNNIPIGNSKHEIYTNIIEFLLSRTSKKHPELQPSRKSSASEIPEYFKSHEFCRKFYSLIKSLAELAYQTLFNETRENTLVFDKTVAEKYLKADDMKSSLLSGLLSESRTLIKEIIKVSFSHKTVQEFFAAIFISSHSVLEKCRNVQDILDMSKMYEFISKVDADRMCEISNDLLSVINEDEKTRDYRTRTGDEYLPDNTLYNIQEVFMSCLQEMPESENIQLCLQDFFIDRRTVHSGQLQRLLKQNQSNINSLYINMYNTSSNLREIIDVLSITDHSHIQKLYFDGDRQKEAEINVLLFSVTLKTLQCLDICNFTLSHKILEILFNFISGQKSLKELTLLTLECKEHGRHDCKRWNLDLSQHSTLSKLHLKYLPERLQLNITTPSLVNVTLWDINLDKSLLLLSRDMLTIERVELRRIEMYAGSLQNFISVLENLPQPVTVKMWDITPETEFDLVRENIRRSQTFHVIQDDGGRWGEFEFKTIKPSKE